MSHRLAPGVTRLAATGAAGLVLILGIASTAATPASAAARTNTTDIADVADVPAATEATSDVTSGTARVTDRLRRDLGTRYGGAWLDPGGRLVVAVTDPAALAPVRAAGATPRLVVRGEAVLVATAARLDRAAHLVPSGVVGWYVDLPTDQVVVQARPEAATAAAAFATAAGAAADAIRVVPTDETPSPLADVLGGDPFRTASGGRCTVGFTVAGGFLTAGHCGRTGELAYTLSGEAMGVFRSSSYPGNDYALVSLYPGWTPVGKVRAPGVAGDIPVHGAVEAAVGAVVCRYGSTTGRRCGTVTAKNQTVVYPGGTVSGLTRTTLCAEPGDSGAPVLAGNQAQGIISGGSGNCTTGGVSYFQPIREPLAVYGLTLLTSR